MNFADKIEVLPIAALKPFDRNARTHSSDQVAKIAASLIEFGWTQPILADDDGDGRTFAALADERLARAA